MPAGISAALDAGGLDRALQLAGHERFEASPIRQAGFVRVQQGAVDDARVDDAQRVDVVLERVAEERGGGGEVLEE